jgi:hypothetical protein
MPAPSKSTDRSTRESEGISCAERVSNSGAAKFAERPSAHQAGAIPHDPSKLIVPTPPSMLSRKVTGDLPYALLT